MKAQNVNFKIEFVVKWLEFCVLRKPRFVFGWKIHSSNNIVQRVRFTNFLGRLNSFSKGIRRAFKWIMYELFCFHPCLNGFGKQLGSRTIRSRPIHAVVRVADWCSSAKRRFRRSSTVYTISARTDRETISRRYAVYGLWLLDRLPRQIHRQTSHQSPVTAVREFFFLPALSRRYFLGTKRFALVRAAAADEWPPNDDRIGGPCVGRADWASSPSIFLSATFARTPAIHPMRFTHTVDDEEKKVIYLFSVARIDFWRHTISASAGTPRPFFRVPITRTPRVKFLFRFFFSYYLTFLDSFWPPVSIFNVIARRTTPASAETSSPLYRVPVIWP